jgi:hypothetical protein
MLRGSHRLFANARRNVLHAGCCFIISIGMFLPLEAVAQINGTGTIQGTVTDPTGAVIPGASVKLREVTTGQERNVITSGAGFYSAAALPPGRYAVTVTATGFVAYTQENIPLDALQIFGLNVKLSLGRSTATVTVTEAPPALDTVSPTLGSSMEVQTYQALPLIMNGQPRDPTAFIYLTPGVTGAGGADQFNGGQTNLNETYIDGIAMDDVNQQSDWAPVHSTFSVDAVDQFQAQTSGISAAYQGQGLQNFTHKSGTNVYHGALFEYFRNTALDSWGFYAPYSINPVTHTAIKPVEHNNEYGGTFGGYIPHFKNKLFFFVSLETEHYIHGTNPGYQTVPTVKERAGDFTELPTSQPIYDPSTTSCSGSTCTRAQFNGPNASGVAQLNVIPASEISPIAKYMQSFLPAPSNSNLTLNYLGGFNTGFNYPRESYKVDWDATSSHRLSFLYMYGGRWANPACCDASGLPLPYTNTVGNYQNDLVAIVSDTWTIGKNMVNKLDYDYNLNGFDSGAGSINPSTYGHNSKWYATSAGITNLPPGQASNSFPKVTWSGSNNPDQWAGGVGSFGGVYAQVYQLTDGVQILAGRHSISIGGNYQWQQSDPVLLQDNTYFSLAYANTATAGFNAAGASLVTTQGESYASFLVGAVNSAGITDDTPADHLYARYRNFSPYVQDDLKVSRRLTLNLGLRWDIFSPWSEKLNRFSFVDLGVKNPITGTPGTLLYGGNGTPGTYCNCKSPIDTWLGNFGPRLGFAYAINNKTVIRGSWGMFYSHAGGAGGRVNANSGPGQLGFNGGASPATSNGGITPAFYLNNAPGFVYQNSSVPSYTHPPNIDPANGTGFTTIAGYTSLSPNGVNFPDPYWSRRAPELEDYNFGVQREVLPKTVLSVNYSGSNGHFLGTSIGRGIYSNQLNPVYYSLGGLLSQPASASNIAKAQAIDPSFTLPFANYAPTASIGQALRSFPQYNGFSDIWGNVGNSHYSSLQMSLKQADIRGFSYGVTYTWAKTIDDTGTSRSAYGFNGRTAGQAETSLSTIDIPNRFTLYWVYNMPFGKGNGNWFVNQLIKNWAFSGITTYQAGTPMIITASGCNTPNGGTCMPSLTVGYTGSPRINGGWGRKNTALTSYSYIDAAAFTVPAAYTLGNAPRSYAYGLRNPGGYDEDVSLRRAFGIWERMKFTLEVSAYNVDNHVNFSAPSTTVGSTSFGVVSAQANSPRDLQASARIDF